MRIKFIHYIFERISRDVFRFIFLQCLFMNCCSTWLEFLTMSVCLRYSYSFSFSFLNCFSFSITFLLIAFLIYRWIYLYVWKFFGYLISWKCWFFWISWKICQDFFLEELLYINFLNFQKIMVFWCWQIKIKSNLLFILQK